MTIPASVLTYVAALESSHAVWEGVKRAKTMSKDQNIVIVRPAFSRIFQ